MGLRETFANAATQLFSAFGDVPADVQFRAYTMGVYDPVTDSEVNTTTDYPVQAFMTRYKDAETDGEIVRRGDVRGIIRQDELSVLPTLNDEVVDGSKVYQIININADPAGALWLLQLRTRSA